MIHVQCGSLSGLTWAKSPYLLVTMAITTGARQGELLRPRWADLDFSARRTYVYKTKNGEPRVLPLTDSIITQLQDLLQRMAEALV